MKSKIVMPLAALVLSTGAAFATQSKQVKALHQGYVQVVENEEIRCEPVKVCSDDAFSPVCTWGLTNTPVKGMDDFGRCTVDLYEIPEN